MNENSAEAELNRTISDMQAQGRALNDALRQFTDGGLTALTQAAQGRTARSAAQDTTSIAASELGRLLRAELSETLRGVFSPAGNGGAMSSGASTINVVIHNNTSAQVSAQETIGSGDQKTLEITIDQMVAQSLAHGRQTGSVLQSLFGLAPSLIGR